MSWSQITKDRMLTACGRHCCICHKFVGLKIELHHIKLKSEGGQDDFDNCIALCFSCHADMSSYDKKHPKGTKYSFNELKLHRDRWIEKFSRPVLTEGDYDQNVDVELYRKLRALIPIETMSELSQHHFGQQFRRSMVRPILDYADHRFSPDDEFVDPELEALRGQLHASALDFCEILTAKTWVDLNDDRIASIPREWKSERYEQFMDAADELNKKADQFNLAYHDLIKAAIRKLKIRVS